MISRILKSIFLLSIFMFLFYKGQSQTITKLKEFKAKGVSGLTVDRLGNFFLTFKNGSIKKYDPDGKVMASMKSKLGEPTLIEPWFHPSIFVYYRKTQQWIVYDRELKNPQVNKLDPSVAVDPYLVCPTNDNKLLVFDKADYSIKKIDRFNSAEVFEFKIDVTKISGSPDFIFMKEYQSMIFLLDKATGIYIYNSIGKLINLIPVHGLNNIGFYGQELFYPTATNVILIDLFTEKSREIPTGKAFRQSCITDERLFGIDNYNTIGLFRFQDSTKE